MVARQGAQGGFSPYKVKIRKLSWFKLFFSGFGRHWPLSVALTRTRRKERKRKKGGREREGSKGERAGQPSRQPVSQSASKREMPNCTAISTFHGHVEEREEGRKEGARPPPGASELLATWLIDIVGNAWSASIQVSFIQSFNPFLHALSRLPTI